MVRWNRSILPKLLWVSSGGRDGWLPACEDLVDLSGDVPFEAADDLLLGLAFGSASGNVGAGVRVPGHAGDGEDVEGIVRLAIAAAIEAITHGLAGTGRNGCDAAEVSERGLAA